jgi:hypothetical protein
MAYIVVTFKAIHVVQIALPRLLAYLHHLRP